MYVYYVLKKIYITTTFMIWLMYQLKKQIIKTAYNKPYDVNDEDVLGTWLFWFDADSVLSAVVVSSWLCL